VPNWLGPAIVKADCIRVRVDEEIVSATYLHWWLNCSQLTKMVEASIHGIGRPRLGMQNIRQLMVPLAPRPEQSRIDARLDNLFSRIDAGEVALRRGLSLAGIASTSLLGANVGALRQAVLASAFSGALTTQSPTDEPVATMLARVRVRRANSEAAKISGNESGPAKPGRGRRKKAVESRDAQGKLL
jgi:type I restriction enzyme S subunit